MDKELENLYIDALNSFSELNNIEPCTKYDVHFLRFNLKNKNFLILINDCKFSLPHIFVETEADYPHYLQYIDDLDARSVCLFKNIEYINTLIPLKEKVKMVISRLIKLESLSNDEIHNEYISEFPIYWNNFAKNSNTQWQLFLEGNKEFEELNVYYYGKNSKTIRIVSPNTYFNDKSDKLDFKNEIALFVKINSLTDLMPPLNGKKWGSTEILKIFCNSEKSKISQEAYNYICSKSFSKKSLKLIFQIDIYYVACEITFKNPGTRKLIDKFQNEILNVEHYKIKRCDLYYLHSSIGNRTDFLDKKILLIGNGSLGSYILEELIKSGLNNITIYDGDIYEPENIFRHKYDFFLCGYNKCAISEIIFNRYHPQINIKSYDKNFSKNENINDYDLIIFTIGKSDDQLMFNEWLNNKYKNKPVIFVWLEGDGKSSHALCTYNNRNGCYNCCFVNENGEYVDNKFNVSKPVEVKLMTDFCGGTRVAYGNSTLLTATYITLKTVEDIFSNKERQSFVYNYTNDTVTKCTNIYSKGCKICNEN